MAIPTNITTSAAAITYIKSTTNLSVSDLRQLALQMDTNVTGTVKAVLLYSGATGIDNVNGSLKVSNNWELAEKIGKDSVSSAKVATIGQTQAADLLNNSDFRIILENAIAKENNLAFGSEAVKNVTNKIFIGESLPDGTRTIMGLWDLKSVDFIKSNVTSSTPIENLVSMAENKGTWTQAELEAIKNSPAPSVSGVSKNVYNDVYTQSYNEAKASNLSDADAKVKALNNVKDAIKVQAYEGMTDINYTRDAAGNVNKVDIGNTLLKDVSGITKTPISNSDVNKISVAEKMGQVLNNNDYRELANGANSLAKQKGYAGYDIDPLRQISNNIDGASTLKTIGAKGLNALGIIGDVVALTLAVAAANEAHAAGNNDKAVRIVSDEVVGMVGGAIGTAVAVAIAAPLLATLGVGVGVGLIAAGIVGAAIGDPLARAAWGEAIETLGEMGMLPKGGVNGLLNDYGWALKNPLALLDPSGEGFLPDFLSPTKNLFNDVPAIPIMGGGGDPLVLDLNGNGIEVSKLGYGAGASTTYFDMDNDGFAERTAWVKGGDGLLALDKNGNGKIDSQNELFGNNNNVADGFTNLKTLDSNNDNKITAADAQFANLRVWVDANGDGKTDAGELKTLADLKITQINLGATLLTGIVNNENTVAATSSFLMNGSTKTVNDNEKMAGFLSVPLKEFA